MDMMLTGSRPCFKKSLSIVLCKLGLIGSIAAHAEAIICPDLKINAVCLNSVWQVNITPQSASWVLNYQDINGKPCDYAQTVEVRWDYAFTTERLYASECGYNLYDNAFGKIGVTNVRGDYYGQPSGSNWQKTSYPGNFKCVESQQTCVFR